MFRILETHENCTVQVIQDMETGEFSIVWWENETEDPEVEDTDTQNMQGI